MKRASGKAPGGRPGAARPTDAEREAAWAEYYQEGGEEPPGR